MRRAKETIESLEAEAERLADARAKAALLQHVRRSKQERALRNMLTLAETEPGIPVESKSLDADPYLLNCRNGTVELRTGRLREHRRGDLITRLAPTDYDPTAGCPTWLAFLNRILGHDTEVLGFTRRALGYALTGDTREQVFFMLYGTGANGKSTMLETIRAVLGDYVMQAAPETFLSKKHGNGIGNDIARLRGARLITSVEVDEGRHLAEALVKQATGGDTVVARFLYGEHFEFTFEGKMFFAVNNKPRISGGDYGIWRRVRLVPFTVTIPPEERDKDLVLKLRHEAGGILSWLVHGCSEWQRESLGEPAAVVQATEAYHEEQDDVGEFLRDCADMGASFREQPAALRLAYANWCATNCHEQMSEKTFAMKLKNKGFENFRSGGKRFWKGLRVKDSVFSEDVSPRDN